ncbi:MAG: SUMF1/EgtB/PvdO family nonheme iron enzyme [Planctomycetes bacterium]|nr:SUMF1/EgtB/PvdO family nonheme iron enzyme [Planctomycetota bacterium]
MRPGTRVANRYVIERKLAQGGMSAVFVALDTKFDRAVALKLAFPETTDYESFRLRFRREAVIGAMLGRLSTGFVRALDWGELEDSSLYLVMDLVVDARELELVTGPRHERLERLARAAALVEEVHGLDIVHRDLKPANFLTSPDGQLHLADFGLAKLLGDPEEERGRDHRIGHLTSTGLALGTPYYMAPEQASAKHVDLRADVYPLGVMLFLALTNELPYQGTLPELLSSQQRVLAGIDPAPTARERDATVPPELDALCRRAMALDPQKRLPSVTAFLESLLPHVSRSAVARARPTRMLTQRHAPQPAPPRREPEAEPLELRSQAFDPGSVMADAASGRRPGASSAPTRPAGAAAPPASSGPPPPPSQLKPIEGEELAFEHERDGSILVWVPAGSFYPGVVEGEGDEEGGITRRAARVEGFYLGRYPITWAQYLHFCHETGRPPPSPSFAVDDDHPVHNVSWDDAQTYCAWAGVRLPTALEWEFAARGADGGPFPWGHEPPDEARCNWAQHPEYGRRTTTPVGLFPDGLSPTGCFDMAGNVLEWVHEGDRPTDGAGAGLTRELRGGAYSLEDGFCDATRGVFLPGETQAPHVGFRVARSATSDSQLLDRTVATRSHRRTLVHADPRAVSQAQRQALQALEDALPWFAQGVSPARGKEIKFTHEEANVGLSVLLTDPLARYAFLEQRVSYQPALMTGRPTPAANLLLTANAIALYSRGLRVVITQDRLRYRREVLLDPTGVKVIDVEVLRHTTDLLIREWSQAFQALKLAQQGLLWAEAAGGFVSAGRPSGDDDAASTVETRLIGSFSTELLSGGKLLVGRDDEPDPAGRIVLTCHEDELCAEALVHAWAPPLDEVVAVKSGDRAPMINALLEELNDKNATRPYALTWDPKRGVVARAHLCGAGIMPTAEQIGQFIELLIETRRMETIETIR